MTVKTLKVCGKCLSMDNIVVREVSLDEALSVDSTIPEFEEHYTKESYVDKIRIKTRNNRREMLVYLVKYGFYFTGVKEEKNIEKNRVLLEKISNLRTAVAKSILVLIDNL